MFLSDEFLMSLLMWPVVGCLFTIPYLLMAIVPTMRSTARTSALKQLFIRLSALSPVAVGMTFLPATVEVRFLLATFAGPSFISLLAIDFYSSRRAHASELDVQLRFSARRFFAILGKVHTYMAATLVVCFMLALCFNIASLGIFISANIAGHFYALWQLKRFSGYIAATNQLDAPTTPLRFLIGS